MDGWCLPRYEACIQTPKFFSGMNMAGDQNQKHKTNNDLSAPMASGFSVLLRGEK